jgi:uncharacterized membrane protein HdeD (DUF308 family)
MVAELARNWWILAIRGLAAILFGIGAFLWPGLTLTVLVLLFGAYALVDGIFAVIAGITGRTEQKRWWMMILEGLAGIVIGVLTFLWPGITAVVSCQSSKLTTDNQTCKVARPGYEPCL